MVLVLLASGSVLVLMKSFLWGRTVTGVFLLDVGSSGLVWLVLDRFLCCVCGLSDQTVGACPLGYVSPGWILTGVQWCTLEC